MRRRAGVVVAALIGLALGCSGPGDGTPSVGTSTGAGPRPAQPGPSQDAAATDAPAGGRLEPSPPYGIVVVTLESPDGGTRLDIEVYDAHLPALRQIGFMHRTELPARAGMVFRYPDDRTAGFWMKNTLIPLSIAYFDAEGVVGTVLDMEPCPGDPCPGYPPDAPYRGALEVNQGFFAEIGLVPGWRVVLPDGLPPPQA